jgi:hypothetical protein
MTKASTLWFRRRFGNFVEEFFLFRYNLFCWTRPCATFLGVIFPSVLNRRIKWVNTGRVTILARSFYFCIYFYIMRNSGEWPGHYIWILLPFTMRRGSLFGVSILLRAGRAWNSKPGVGRRFYYLQTTSKSALRVYPASITVVDVVLSQWQISRSMTLATHLLVPPRLRKSRAILCTFQCLHGRKGENLLFFSKIYVLKIFRSFMYLEICLRK